MPWIRRCRHQQIGDDVEEEPLIRPLTFWLFMAMGDKHGSHPFTANDTLREATKETRHDDDTVLRPWTP